LDRRLLIALMTALLTAAWFCLPSTVANAPPADEPDKAIRKLLDDQAVAWNKGDLEGFMAGYWKSPELSFVSGAERTKGWQATIERYRKTYQAEGKEMGKLDFRDLEVNMLGMDSAYVLGVWRLKTSKGEPGGRFTLIVKKLP